MLTLNQEGGGRIDIPLDELSTVGYILTVNATKDGIPLINTQVSATNGDNVFTGMTDSNGMATVIITENGIYTVSIPSESAQASSTIPVTLSSSVSINIESIEKLTLGGTINLRNLSVNISYSKFGSAKNETQYFAHITDTNETTDVRRISCEVEGYSVRLEDISVYGYKYEEQSANLYYICNTNDVRVTGYSGSISGSLNGTLADHVFTGYLSGIACSESGGYTGIAVRIYFTYDHGFTITGVEKSLTPDSRVYASSAVTLTRTYRMSTMSRYFLYILSID